MKKDTFNVFEITHSHVKFLQAKVSRSGTVIKNLQFRPVRQHTDEELIKLISSIAAMKGSDARHAAVVIPRRLTILRQISLPSQDKDEIRKMVSLQLVNKIPYSLEDVVCDHIILDQDKPGYTSVLVVVVHKEIVQRYLKIFSQAKVNVQNFILSSVGLMAWFNHQARFLKGSSASGLGFINLDHSESEMCFILQGKLLFSRSIPMGAGELSAETAVKFAEQVDLTLKSFKKERMGPDIQGFLIAGDTRAAHFLKEKLSEEFKLPVETVNAFDNIPCQKEVDFKSSLDGGFASAVGWGSVLAFAAGHPMSLMPTEINDTKISLNKRSQWIRSFLLGAASLILVTAAFNIKIYQDMNGLNRLQAKLKEIKPRIQQAQKVMAVVEAADQNIYKKIFVADIISELYRLTPQDVAFRSLVLDDQGALTIQGYSQSPSSINVLQSQLVASVIFKEVNLQYASRVRNYNQDLIEFKIVCQLKNKRQEK